MRSAYIGDAVRVASGDCVDDEPMLLIRLFPTPRLGKGGGPQRRHAHLELALQVGHQLLQRGIVMEEGGVLFAQRRVLFAQDANITP